jgi:hypothetical protein
MMISLSSLGCGFHLNAHPFRSFLFVSRPLEAVGFQPPQVSLHDERTAGFGIFPWQFFVSPADNPGLRRSQIS